MGGLWEAGCFLSRAFGAGPEVECQQCEGLEGGFEQDLELARVGAEGVGDGEHEDHRDGAVTERTLDVLVLRAHGAERDERQDACDDTDGR